MIDAGSAPALLAPLLSGGALAGICFIAIAAFGVVAVISLTRHIRRSNHVWEGEVDGGIPLHDEPLDAGRSTPGRVEPASNQAALRQSTGGSSNVTPTPRQD